MGVCIQKRRGFLHIRNGVQTQVCLRRFLALEFLSRMVVDQVDVEVVGADLEEAAALRNKDANMVGIMTTMMEVKAIVLIAPNAQMIALAATVTLLMMKTMNIIKAAIQILST